jgi:hypothetical protein
MLSRNWKDEWIIDEKSNSFFIVQSDGFYYDILIHAYNVLSSYPLPPINSPAGIVPNIPFFGQFFRSRFYV